jgi:CheY-like chemotaxis protein
VRDILEAAARHGVTGLHTGVAGAEARYRRKPVAMRSERARSPAPAPPTVLIAEDDPDVTRIVDAQMKAAGYRTVICFDGRQVLEALQASVPDVLVLDLRMPKLNGFDVLARLREMPVRPRVIVLSGHAREEGVTGAFDLGADDYLTKPFGPAS